MSDHYSFPGYAAVAKAIGIELRQARESRGWSRRDLVAKVSEEIHPQTLAMYERGDRQCTVGRLAELCSILGISTSATVGRALQRAEITLQTEGLDVDLHAIIKDKQPELLPLRRWARKRLEDMPGNEGIAHLAWAGSQEMATLFGIDHTTFVRQLITFVPQAPETQ